MSTTKMDNSTSKCPFTVTVRRNPPRRARATPLHGITPFPNEDILSEQISQIPATLQDENLINPSAPENENLINPSAPENENLKVFLRIRPFQLPNQAPRVRTKTAWPKNQTKNVTNSSKKKSSSSCISINDSQSVTLLVPSDLQDAKRVKSETYGGFSHVFPSDSSQLEVYERMVKPMVDEFIKGKSGMLAALGPSGSGKTHTVFGTPRDRGMVPLVLRHIFKETEASRSYYVAIFEIYTERGKSEKLFDLLPDGSELSMQQSTIKGQKEVLICNAEQAESLIAQAVIKRATAMTNTNSQSSRSQCIINIRDAPKKCKGGVNSKSNNAVLTIIDLAGAEREKRTGNQGTRLVESNFINNTLMVFGLCLRSLLEHQKNPKKQLQKHFQNSMLTRYLRDYLEGKKRMTLLLTAKSGEDDYLDTSHLLRQASPYMQIKYNEVEPSINMVPKKRHHQASSIIDSAKQSPSLAHLKRVRLVSEHTVQKAEKGVEECNTSKKDTSTVCKFDASSSVPLKSECDSHVGSERSHIIMRNFARVLWNVLKQYNSKLKVAESEILSLKESIGYEKDRNLELETQLNAFRVACTCCKEGNEKINAEDCSLVDLLDHLHNLDQEETFEAESSSEPRIDLSDEEHILGTTSTKLDSNKSERKVSVSSSKSKSANHNALEADYASKETFHAESSSHPRLEQPDDEHKLGTTYTELDSEKLDREISVSFSNLGHHSTLDVDAVCKIPCEFNVESLSEPRLDQSDAEHMLCSTCSVLDYEKSDRKLSVSLSKPGHHNALEVDAMDKMPCEIFHPESSPELPEEEHMLGSTCTVLDSEKSDREVSVSLSNSGIHKAFEVNAVRTEPNEIFHPESSPELPDEEHMLDSTCTVLDSEKSDREVSVSLSNSGIHKAFEVNAVRTEPNEIFHPESSPELPDEHMLGSTCTVLDSEKSDREVSVSLSNSGIHKAFEVNAVRTAPNETFNAESPAKPKIDQLDEEHMLGSTLESEISDREVSVSSSKPGHDNSLEVDVVSKITRETFHAQTSSEPRLDFSNEKPMTDPDRQLESEKSDSLVLGVSASSSKPEDHKDLVVEAKSKIPSELLNSSLSTKDGILDPSLPKDVSFTKTQSDILDPSLPKDVSSTKAHSDILDLSLPKDASSTKTQRDKGVSNSSCKPPRSKRILMPSSSMLSRNMSTSDLFDESEKLKENRGTRKLGARNDPKRSNGSISLLHMLQGRKGNIRH